MSRGTRKGVGKKNLNGTLTSIWRRAPKITSQLNRGRTGEREILRSYSDRFAEERQKSFSFHSKWEKGVRGWYFLQRPLEGHLRRIDQFPPGAPVASFGDNPTEPFTLIAFCGRFLDNILEECRW